jgi:DNA-binding response OmpR family regulator
MLPGMDGLTLTRKIRERWNTPVIMVTARGDDADKIVGLELGADDYLAKPFNPRELLARIRAVLRRAPADAEAPVFESGGLRIDFAAREVRVEGVRQSLTAHEYDLLSALARNAGRVLSRDQLLELVKGEDADEAFDRSIDVHVSRLRQKIEPDPRHPRYVKTVRGAGYLLARES